MQLFRRVCFLLGLLILPALGIAESTVGVGGANALYDCQPGQTQQGESPCVPAEGLPSEYQQTPTRTPYITNTPSQSDADKQQMEPSFEDRQGRPEMEYPKDRQGKSDRDSALAPRRALEEPMQRSEFQDFITQSTGLRLPLFGYNLFENAPSTFAPVDQIPVASDYVVGPGDEILIRAWGQIDIDLRAPVDRNGNVNIPKVGDINVAGIRYSELQGYLKTAIGRVFRNFDLNVTLGNLRSIQVFVVGQARRPGSYTVSSLSTLVNTLFASGGPSSKGSMRHIQLKRNNRVVTEMDLYDLLIKGDKSKDAALLPGDVIYIPPVGALAAISGSVNVPAIYELKADTTLDNLLQLAGGLTTTAAGQKVTVERIDNRTVRKVAEFPLDSSGLARGLRDGDLVRVLALSPRFDNAVTLRGYVATPARYPWHEGMRIRDLIPEKNALIVPDYWAKQNALIVPDYRTKQNALIPSDYQIKQNTSVKSERLGAEALHNELKQNVVDINWSYAAIERLKTDTLTTTLIPFNLGKAILENDSANNLLLAPGDVVTIFSRHDIQVPVAEQTKFIRLEGEINRAGVYTVEPGETLRQLVARIGGLTPNAYLFGAEFTRESTRISQQKKIDEAVDRLERNVERAASTKSQNITSPEAASGLQATLDSQRALVERLRKVKATGRIVLEINPDNQRLKDIPDLVLEDGDRLYVPTWHSTVGVIGEVYNENTYIYKSGKRIGDYLALAGGPTKDADADSIYVLRADGSVISKQQSGWLRGFNGDRLNPGDTVVVPEQLDKTKWTTELKDWTQIVYQLGLGAAAIKVLQ